MNTQRTSVQRRALGDFLKAHRARLTPAALGLPRGIRRRTKGLRREEVAQLAGMSATWYTWIEQGRDVSVSAAALDRLAKVLQLTRAERAYLFDLAGRRDPAKSDATDTSKAPAGLADAVKAMLAPAYILDRAWRARAWNALAQRLFVGWLDSPGDHNLLRYIFLEPQARRLIVDWEDRARRVIAEFRAEAGAHLTDPEIAALVADLCRESQFFARAWDEQSVTWREGGERVFDHPQDGIVRYEQITFTMASRPEFKLVLLVEKARPES